MIERRGLRGDLQGQQVDLKIVDRHYQMRVIQSLGESFMQAQRKGLLAMATGSQKPVRRTSCLIGDGDVSMIGLLIVSIYQ